MGTLVIAFQLGPRLPPPADGIDCQHPATGEVCRGSSPDIGMDTAPMSKRVFDLVKDFGTSESPKSTRSSTTHWCPGRPGHPAFRHNIASSLRLHTGLPYDWTPRSDAPLGSPLAPSARRVSRVASRLPETTRLRFALHGGGSGCCGPNTQCGSSPVLGRVPSSASLAARLIRRRNSSSDSCGRFTSKRNPCDS